MLYALWEVVALMWIYGYRNFSKDIALMIGSEPWWLTKICWAVFCPVALLLILILSVYSWTKPIYGGVSVTTLFFSKMLPLCTDLFIYVL